MKNKESVFWKLLLITLFLTVMVSVIIDSAIRSSLSSTPNFNATNISNWLNVAQCVNHAGIYNLSAIMARNIYSNDSRDSLYIIVSTCVKQVGRCT
jgi:hypothetical protein